MAPLQLDENERLNGLWNAYRLACGEPEPSPEFMPRLWQKIEARQRVPVLFRRLAAGLATAAAAASLILFLFSAPAPPGANFYALTYLEVLAEDHAAQSPGYAEPVSVERDSESELLNEML